MNTENTIVNQIANAIVDHAVKTDKNYPTGTAEWLADRLVSRFEIDGFNWNNINIDGEWEFQVERDAIHPDAAGNAVSSTTDLLCCDFHPAYDALADRIYKIVDGCEFDAEITWQGVHDDDGYLDYDDYTYTSKELEQMIEAVQAEVARLCNEKFGEDAA